MSETRSGYNVTTKQIRIVTRRLMINQDTPMSVLRQEINNHLHMLEETGSGSILVKYKDHKITEIEIATSQLE